jgi:hypothetical protein
MLRDILKLIRIQSTPVTLCILCAGYGLRRGTVLEPLIVPLLAIGAVGHWGFYSMNEYMDRHHDWRQGKDDKPLVGGGITISNYEFLSISTDNVQIFVMILIGLSVLWGAILMPTFSFLCYLGAALCGAGYNITSKTHTLSALWLAIWAELMVLSGFFYAGGV